MRVQTEEWQRFIPGVRMYKGKKTLFWNGQPLWEGGQYDGRPLVYNWEERQSWEVIVILPGVEVIPEWNFVWCENVETVIMADTVKRIEVGGFYECESLNFVRLSKNLEYIGNGAFQYCYSLTSIFIPPSCREIEEGAFYYCKRLLILGMPQHTQLGKNVIGGTALICRSPFETDEWGNYGNTEEVHEFIKTLNQQDEKLALHCECASYEASEDNIFEIIKYQGLPSIHVKNHIGLTAFEYLRKNPNAEIEINETKLINRYVLDKMFTSENETRIPASKCNLTKSLESGRQLPYTITLHDYWPS